MSELGSGELTRQASWRSETVGTVDGRVRIGFHSASIPIMVEWCKVWVRWVNSVESGEDT